MIGVLAVAVVSCKDESWHNGEPGADIPTGELAMGSLSVEVDDQSTPVAKAPAARAGVDASGFIVKVSDSEGALVNQWTYSAMPEVLTLPVGDYTVDVASGVVEKAAWDAPFYAGSTRAAITEGQVTDLGTVLCRLANVKVSVVYDEDLKSKLGSDAQVTVLVNDDGSLVYGRDETRAGYFEYLPGSNTLVAEFSATIKGAAVKGRKALTDIKAGYHYILTFKAKNFDTSIPPEAGTIDPSAGGGIGVDLDVTTVGIDGTVSVDEDMLDDSDRPGGSGGGETPTSDITLTSALDFENPNDVVDGMDGKVYIKSKNPIAHLYVEISSSSAEFEGMITQIFQEPSFDLAEPGDKEASFDELNNTVENVNFPYGDAVLGQTDVLFDITGFIPMLEVFEGTHTFKLKVVDNIGGSRSGNLVLIVKK